MTLKSSSREGSGHVKYISTVIPQQNLNTQSFPPYTDSALCKLQGHFETSEGFLLEPGIRTRLFLNKLKAVNQATDLFVLVWPRTSVLSGECACLPRASSATDAILESQDHSEPGKSPESFSPFFTYLCILTYSPCMQKPL